MNWTDKRPTGEGYYWFRCVLNYREPITADADVVWVWRQGLDGVLVAHIPGEAMETPVEKIEGEWAGPLEPPQ